MIRLLLSLFLMLNSLAGLWFYEDTAFGDYLYSRGEFARVIFILINFVVSHGLIILLNTPMAIISLFLLILILALFLLAFGIWLPYWIIYVLFDASGESVFAGVTFMVLLVGTVPILLSPILRVLLDFLENLTNSFFENLKQNAINSAIDKTKRSK